MRMATHSRVHYELCRGRCDAQRYRNCEQEELQGVEGWRQKQQLQPISPEIAGLGVEPCRGGVLDAVG